MGPARAQGQQRHEGPATWFCWRGFVSAFFKGAACNMERAVVGGVRCGNTRRTGEPAEFLPPRGF